MGELARIDMRLLRIDTATLRRDLADAEFDADAMRRQILATLGLLPDAGVVLDPTAPVLDLSMPDDLEAYLILQNNNIAVARAEYKAAEEALRLEIRKQYPDITIGAGPGSEDDDDRLLLGVSVPIPVLNANRAGIAQAKASRESARVEAEAAFEIELSELSSAIARHRHVTEQLASYERDVIPMLAEQRDDLQRLISLGEFDAVLLLESLSKQLEAELAVLGLQRDEYVTSITIERLLGPDPKTDSAGTVLNTERNAPREESQEVER